MQKREIFQLSFVLAPSAIKNLKGFSSKTSRQRTYTAEYYYVGSFEDPLFSKNTGNSVSVALGLHLKPTCSENKHYKHLFYVKNTPTVGKERSRDNPLLRSDFMQSSPT